MYNNLKTNQDYLVFLLPKLFASLELEFEALFVRVFAIEN